MAQTKINTTFNFGNSNRIINLAPAVQNGQPVVLEQLNSAIQGLSWKDNVRTASSVNVIISAPGSTIGGVTLTNNDTLLLYGQTDLSENGIWVFNGSSTPMSRSPGADTFLKLENAIVAVDEGTYVGALYRQTQVNGVLGADDVIWVELIPTMPDATETAKGRIEIATQAEVNTGTDNTRAVTPATLAAYTGYVRKYHTIIGDGTSTNFTITHNLQTEHLCNVNAIDLSNNKYYTIVSWRVIDLNNISVEFDADNIIAANSLDIIVSG